MVYTKISIKEFKSTTSSLNPLFSGIIPRHDHDSNRKWFSDIHIPTDWTFWVKELKPVSSLERDNLNNKFQKHRQQQTCDQLELSLHDLEISKQKNQVSNYNSYTHGAVCSAVQDQSKSWNSETPSPQFYLTLSNSEESLGKMNVGQTTGLVLLTSFIPQWMLQQRCNKSSERN